MEHFEFLSKILYVGKPVLGDPNNPNRFCIVSDKQVFIYDSIDELLNDFRTLLSKS